MLDTVCSHKDSISVTIMAIIFVVEYFVGRSDKVKANSTIELVIKGVADFGRFIFQKRR